MADMPPARPPCTEQPRLFFAPHDANGICTETRSERFRRVDAARALCKGCDRRQDCWTDAITANDGAGEAAGVWAGLDFPEEAARAQRIQRDLGLDTVAQVVDLGLTRRKPGPKPRATRGESSVA